MKKIAIKSLGLLVLGLGLLLSTSAIAGPLLAQGPRYQKGAEIEVVWQGTWWAARVVEVRSDPRLSADQDLYKISYDGWARSWDEWVELSRMRDRVPSPPPPKGGYKVGHHVEVLWGGSWWKAKVTAVKGKQSQITYDGWDRSWDEWVDHSRIRPRQ
jgi:hypothetical protein